MNLSHNVSNSEDETVTASVVLLPSIAWCGSPLKYLISDPEPFTASTPFSVLKSSSDNYEYFSSKCFNISEDEFSIQTKNTLLHIYII